VKPNDFLLYGATGYVGRAVAELAVERGLRPLLAGRSATSLEPQAGELDVEYRVVALDDPDTLAGAMATVPVVLNCAGPFVHTFEPIVDACLATGTHYVDITGEPPVYASIATRHDAAESAGVMLLPGAGFDVVPTDCLAAHLVRRLPTATHLTLAFSQHGPAGLPPGTLNTMIEMLAYGSSAQHRVDGAVVTATPRKKRMVDFGDGPVPVSMLTWGDVFVAYRSTGIPNIDDYAAFPPGLFRQMDLIDRVRPLFRMTPIRNLAKKAQRGGATAEERAATSTAVWGEVTDDAGGSAVARLHGPEAGLIWTSRAVLGVVERILSGEFTPGYQTPATAYGPDLVLDTEGVTRQDVE
jgi:short subunit dehydrogenase-like uncharacterized protein